MRSIITGMNLTLIGMPGSGKTVVGRELAHALGYTVIDPDKIIEVSHGTTLQEVLDSMGEAEFLRTEALLSLKVMHEADATILATGGSIIYSEDAMEWLSAHSRVVYLKVEYDTVARRVGDTPRGIVGLGRKTLRELYDERCALYDRWAHVTIDGSKKPHEVASDIRAALGV
jgi:shikimate kinase